MYSGKDIFKLHDQFGLPFETIVDLLREEGKGFNCEEWIECAVKAKWKSKKIKDTLKYNYVGEDFDKLEIKIDEILNKEL